MSIKERYYNYNIHNILTFKIVDENRVLNKIFDTIKIEYKNFESQELKKPDFTIYLGKFTPSNQDCFMLDNKYYVKEDYFYCKDSHKIAKWEFEMSGFETDELIVRISANPFASMVISGFLIDPLILLKMNENGRPIVHGSCVSKDGHAYLFTAQGGSGKTSTALYSVERGFDFLGDNFIILDKGYALSFLSPLNIFSFNLVPIVKKNMDIKSKAEFYFKVLLHRMGGPRVVTKINVNSVFPDTLDDESELESIFLLLPKEKFKIVEMDKNELIHHMVANMKLDSFPFIKYMMEYSFMFPESKMATHWQRYEENLRKNLNDYSSIYRVEVPQKYDMKTFEGILRVIQNGTKL